MGHLKLSGSIAWIAWCLVHVFFLIGFRSKAVVAFDWLWSFVTRQRSARLISDSAPRQRLGGSGGSHRTESAPGNIFNHRALEET
jgi:NADH:quinone reductase (non-electrogenic)